MPIYEYRCDACGKDFERFVQMGATAVACPGCESGNVKRTLSIVAFKTSSGFVPSTMSSGGSCCGGGCACH